MDDRKIIELFFQRSETALEAMKTKYGARAQRLAGNLLRSREDGEECINDALLALWQRIPPEKPDHLWAYFSRILRNLCCSRLDHLCAARRDRGMEVCISELEDCFATDCDPQKILESRQITEVINRFLDGLDGVNRRIFVRRYYYFDSCGDIAKQLGMNRGAVNTRLSRLRTQLREQLEKEALFL